MSEMIAIFQDECD